MSPLQKLSYLLVNEGAVLSRALVRHDWFYRIEYKDENNEPVLVYNETLPGVIERAFRLSVPKESS